MNDQVTNCFLRVLERIGREWHDHACAADFRSFRGFPIFEQVRHLIRNPNASFSAAVIFKNAPTFAAQYEEACGHTLDQWEVLDRADAVALGRSRV